MNLKTNASQNSETEILFRPFELGDVHLPHRIVMGPLTRSRAGQPGNVPTGMNAEYYAQRASAALTISEATQISPQGQGYAWTPGIHTSEQVEGWRQVVDRVHHSGGRIFLQLWHVGRISHRTLQPRNEAPVAPSAVKPAGKAFVPGPGGKGEFVPLETPRALTVEEVGNTVQDYATAARNAKEAGFDGVEIHGANGYLVDQFLCSTTNRRTDEYGGSVENRARFLFEIIDRVGKVWPRERVGLRLSPRGNYNDIDDANPEATFGHVFERLNGAGIAYLHLPRPNTAGGPDVDEIGARDMAMLKLARDTWRGPLMLAGGFTGEIAARWIAEGRMDLAVFGRKFLANPDLPRRFRKGAPLNEPQKDTFYGGGAHGYTDYPSLSA